MNLDHNLEAMKRAAQPAPPASARKTFEFTPEKVEAIRRAADQSDLVGNAVRLQILYMLEVLGECDVTTMVAACGLGSSAIAQQLRKLKDGGMVAVRPEQQSRIYRRLPHPVADFALGLVGG